jgi:hypothetical protein
MDPEISFSYSMYYSHLMPSIPIVGGSVILAIFQTLPQPRSRRQRNISNLPNLTAALIGETGIHRISRLLDRPTKRHVRLRKRNDGVHVILRAHGSSIDALGFCACSPAIFPIIR